MLIFYRLTRELNLLKPDRLSRFNVKKDLREAIDDATQAFNNHNAVIKTEDKIWDRLVAELRKLNPSGINSL